jgi:citrate lyase subunit beta / citryl-CoA lyase
MRMRSLLFVPGDRPERMQRAFGLGADALILDLEDAVAPAAKPEARRHVAEFLRANEGAPLWVRINPLGGPEAEKDLEAVAPAEPAGIILPKAQGGASVNVLALRLAELGNLSSRILPIANETAASIFEIGSFPGAQRLAGITWGAEDLSAAIGAAAARELDGRLIAPAELARSLCLFGAASAEVAAIETVYPDFRDTEGLGAYASRARRHGFAGMLAIHPLQVDVINTAFTPTKAEIDHARAVVAAFEANPGAGALALDGKMIDRPHLLQAQRTLGSLIEEAG